MGDSIVVGIDPDAESHGVAIYVNGQLRELASLQTAELVSRHSPGRLYSIENAMYNQFLYGRNRHANRSVRDKVAMSVGRVQQAQVELMRALDFVGAQYVLHKPQKGNWAEDETQFRCITGWTARSSKDKRSAAFFGYLALGQVRRLPGE